MRSSVATALTLPPAYRPLLAPGVILLIAALAAAAPALPPSLAGLWVLGPYAALGFAAAISAWFNRGRAFVAAASLLAAYAGYRTALDINGPGFAAQMVFTALVVLVPLNILIALACAERGVVHHRNYRWLLLVLAEVLLVAWIAGAGRSSLPGTAWHGVLDHWLFRSPPMPLIGRLMFAAAFAAAAARAWPRHPETRMRSLDVGLGAALVAFFIAFEWVASPAVFAAFMSAAGAVLLVAVLQESHRLAFSDELTGLPSRRALQERLPALGPVCAVAMVDVDHFKQFNDAHGHDVGDQVLRLVAARLAEVGGGGKAHRYGGEEFCVLFDGRALDEALPYLERIRASVEHYRMAVRGEDRPKDAKAGSQRRVQPERKPADKTLSVTVSIGVADRRDTRMPPVQVIRAADEALYRAKQAGRNRVAC